MMINLLPTDYRQRLRYNRINGYLRRWIITGVFLIAGLVVLIGSSWIYLDKQVKDLNDSIAATQQKLEQQHLKQIQAQADQISGNIRTINQVLSREIRFSDLIQDIGKVMPPGTVLGSLTLARINGALDLSANAKDYASAAQIAVNLSDPQNNIFEKVDIININCGQNASSQYKCTAVYKALFSKTTLKRYLNGVGGNS